MVKNNSIKPLTVIAKNEEQVIKQSLYKIHLFLLLLLITQLCNAQFINQRYPIFDNVGATGLNAVENDSGYLTLGFYLSNTTGRQNMRLIQTDFYGDVLIEKIYADTTLNYFGGWQNSLTKLVNGGYALYGGRVEVPGVHNKCVLYRFDEFGDTLWTKTYGDTSYFQTGRHMRQTLDGGFILIGENATTSENIWVIKTDSLGVLEWEKTYGGPNYEGPAHIAVCADGGYIFSGNTKSLGPNIPNEVNIRIMKIDSFGNEEFTKVFGEDGSEAPWAIEPTQDGGFIFGGSLESDADGHTRPYAIRMDSIGDTVWTKTFDPFTGITLLGYFTSMFELPDGSFIGAGFNWQTDSVVVARYQGLVIKMDANGNKLWQKEYTLLDGNGSDHRIMDLRPTSDGGFICAGTIYPAAPDTGTQDMWLLKLDSNGCADTACTLITNVPNTQHSQLSTNSLALYPNPTNGIVTIELPKESTNGNFRLLNINGKEVFNQNLNSSSNQIDVSHLSTGIYFYRYRDNKQGHAGKLVLQ